MRGWCSGIHKKDRTSWDYFEYISNFEYKLKKDTMYNVPFYPCLLWTARCSVVVRARSRKSLSPLPPQCVPGKERVATTNQPATRHTHTYKHTHTRARIVQQEGTCTRMRAHTYTRGGSRIRGGIRSGGEVKTHKFRSGTHTKHRPVASSSPSSPWRMLPQLKQR